MGPNIRKGSGRRLLVVSRGGISLFFEWGLKPFLKYTAFFELSSSEHAHMLAMDNLWM